MDMESSECKTYTLTELEQKDAISWITLNNPQKKNALSATMISELIELLKEIADDENQRVVVIQGADGVFCSGADLDWMRQGVDQNLQQNMEDAQLFYRLYSTLFYFPKPVMVWVEKFAFGGATGIIACADYVLSDKNSVFGFPEVKLGLVPGTIAPFIVKKISFNHAKSYMLSGETFSAKKAKKIGFVNEIVKAENKEERIKVLAEQFKKNSPEAITSTKHLLNRIVDNGELNEDMANLCCHTISSARISNEGQEGVNAFFEKRKPYWIKD
ncbi:enoyl-CoA hydratase/isomerase family protein [Carboxylicivirga linearis]|nr:enoyl-CoA hydratase-related protein [Carboxylicivirga linearis]